MQPRIPVPKISSAKPSQTGAGAAPRIGRSGFNLSHQVGTTMPLNGLVPLASFEVLPGDIIKGSTAGLIRTIPINSALMHELEIKFVAVYNPLRIIWDNAPQFFNNGISGVGTPIVAPTVDWGNGAIGYTVTEGSLANYLGLPVGLGGTLTPEISPLQFRAYNKTVNDWFINTNIDTPLATFTSDDDDDEANENYLLFVPRWQKDYFTSAFITPQAGPSVEIAVGTTAPVLGTGDPAGFDILNTITSSQVQIAGNQRITPVLKGNTIDTVADATNMVMGFNDGDIVHTGTANTTLPDQGNVWGNLGHSETDTGLYADLANASGISAITLRELMATQRWKEKAMRAGLGTTAGRHISYLREFYGVISSDARLQRSELISHWKAPIIISEVVQTGESGTTPQGNIAGHGITGVEGDHWTYASEEHGFIQILAWISVKPQYQQGLHRKWTRFSPMQYAYPDFALIGEQAVNCSELFFDDTDSAYNDSVFGYQRQYAEYMELVNQTTGQMVALYDYWNMTRQFTAGSGPTLDSAFIQQDADQRPFAVTNPATHPFICQFVHQIEAIRPLPRFEEEYRIL